MILIIFYKDKYLQIFMNKSNDLMDNFIFLR